MAEQMSKKEKKLSKEIRVFARDLYDYIWTKHRFRSSCLENYFADKMSMTLVRKKGKSRFNQEFGKFIVSSQYLLRDLCSKVFSFMEDEMFRSEPAFVLCVYSVIYEWLPKRLSVAAKTIDTAAIIAESVLFCDSNKTDRRRIVFDLDRIPHIFAYFFETELIQEFSEKGGWPIFERDFNMYIAFLNIDRFLPSQSLPYEKLEYTSTLIDCLADNYVKYPVEVSKLFDKCTCYAPQLFEFALPKVYLDELVGLLPLKARKSIILSSKLSSVMLNDIPLVDFNMNAAYSDDSFVGAFLLRPVELTNIANVRHRCSSFDLKLKKYQDERREPEK